MLHTRETDAAYALVRCGVRPKPANDRFDPTVERVIACWCLRFSLCIPSGGRSAAGLKLETVLKSTPTFEYTAKLALNEGPHQPASFGAQVHAV